MKEKQDLEAKLVFCMAGSDCRRDVVGQYRTRPVINDRELAGINQITGIMIEIIIIGVIVDKYIFRRIENKVLSECGLL